MDFAQAWFTKDRDRMAELSSAKIADEMIKK
jgi:hypothetical protein